MVTISEAKAQLSRLISDAERGERVVIGRAGRPVAVLTAYTIDAEPRRLGGWRGRRVVIADDFDSPLPPDVLTGFDGRQR